MLLKKESETSITDDTKTTTSSAPRVARNHSPHETVKCRFSGNPTHNATVSNTTGMPNRLKLGLEQQSGYDLSAVRVHYNSPQPSRIGALAYTQGTNIHIAPRQEKHLPHEGWHVVQQMQGRVQPTLHNNGVAINNQRQLEKEADVMGTKALRNPEHHSSVAHTISPQTTATIQSAVIQKTEDEAIALAKKYGKKDYKNWEEVRKNWHDFTSAQQEDITEAKNAVEIRNASNDIVPYQPLTANEKRDLALRKLRLQRQDINPVYFHVLTYLKDAVVRVFGKTGLNEFYRGAHIVFNDNRQVYDDLFQIAKSIAAKEAEQDIETPKDVMTKNDAAGTAAAAAKEYSKSWLGKDVVGRLSKAELEEGRMMRRRPEAGETSHYKDEEGDPNYPQLGIDLPLVVKGHILFGIVPGTTNTFVQTEGAGFQDLEQHVKEHGKGAFWNMTPLMGGWQTGLVGSTKASEKTGTHLQE